MKIKLLALLVVAALATVFAQGPLTPPPGAPAPVMKTLDQVEPRTPIDDAHTPGDATYHYIISQPGSYYLTGNLAVTKTSGICISSSNVTLDLSGFEVRRPGVAGGTGIQLNASVSRCVVRNGTIRGFAIGVTATGASPSAHGGYFNLSVSNCSDYGLYGHFSWQIDGCKAHDNAGDGIRAIEGSVITNCTVRSNGGYGIHSDYAVMVTNCVAVSNAGGGIIAGKGTVNNCAAFENQGSYGLRGQTMRNCIAHGNSSNIAISVDSGGTIDGCSATFNRGTVGISVSNGTMTNCSVQLNNSGNTATSSSGISADHSTVIGCTSSDNTGNVVSSETGVGIDAGNGSTVTGCTITNNQGDGIQVVADCHVSGNTCAGNGDGQGLPSDGSNIRIFGSANRVEGNLVTSADIGIAAEANRNFIARNTARTNTLNYVIVAGNRIAQIVVPATNGAAINGANSGSSDGFTNVDPWANFSF